MDQRILQASIAITFLLLAIYYSANDVLTAVGVDRFGIGNFYNFFKYVLVFFALLSAILTIIDIRKN